MRAITSRYSPTILSLLEAGEALQAQFEDGLGLASESR